MALQIVPLTIVLIYLLAMLGIGFFTNKFLIKSSEDYMLAGRRLGVIFVAASLAANNVGGGSSVGVASKAFGSWGLSAGWYVLAAAIGVIPLAYFAPYIRRALATTIPEVIGRRFGKPSHIFTSVLHMLAMFCLTASQMLASGTIIAAITGLNLSSGILIAGGISIAYTIMGGLWADAFSDLIQWVIIFLGLLISLPFIINGGGGWNQIMATLPPDHWSFFKVGWKTILGLIIMYFMTFLSGPEIISRLYAAEDEKAARKASLLGAVLMGVYAFIPALIGLVALAKFPEINANSALVTAVTKLAPSWVAGIVCSAIIAATMSSADSDMLCASTIFVKDIYQRYINPKVSDKTMIVMGRALNAIVGLLAMGIALFKINIITLNVFAFTLRSAGPFAAYGLGLIWPKATKNAGVWSIITGTIAAFIWQYLKEPYGIMAIVVGSIIGVATFALITWIESSQGVPPAPSAFDWQNDVQAVKKPSVGA